MEQEVSSGNISHVRLAFGKTYDIRPSMVVSLAKVFHSLTHLSLEAGAWEEYSWEQAEATWFDRVSSFSSISRHEFGSSDFESWLGFLVSGVDSRSLRWFSFASKAGNRSLGHADGHPILQAKMFGSMPSRASHPRSPARRCPPPPRWIRRVLDLSGAAQPPALGTPRSSSPTLSYRHLGGFGPRVFFHRTRRGGIRWREGFTVHQGRPDTNATRMPGLLLDGWIQVPDPGSFGVYIFQGGSGSSQTRRASRLQRA